MEFKHLRDAVATQLARLLKHNVFKVAFPLGESGAHLDQLYNLYQDSFPAGTNEIYRKQREYECSCCRSFIRAVGGMVAVIDGKLETIWDVKVPKEPGFQPVVDAMATYIRTLPIDNVFTHFQAQVGQDKSFETIINGATKDVRTWNHFSATLPNNLVLKESGPLRSEKRATYDVFMRGMLEITIEALNEVTDIVASKGIYKHEEIKGPLQLYFNEKKAFDALPDDRATELYCWSRSLVLSPAISRLGNTSLGELLYNLSSDRRDAGGNYIPTLSLDDAVKAYEAMVAPSNYKRSTALVTPKMIAAAKETMASLGLTSALQRRFATLGDITVNNSLFVDRTVKPKLSGGNPFDDLAATVSSNVKVSDKIDEVSIEHFIAEVLPRVESIEALVENHHAGNFVSLIAPEDPTAALIFKWPNSFSWSYTGDVTDSIAERVKAAGGRIEGDLCCRLAWEYTDDLDFHMTEPNGYDIGFTNRGRLSPAGGILDVDANGGSGMMDHPVENIVYDKAATMKEGQYSLYVNNFCRRSDGVGFEVEIEFHGKKFTFAYDRIVPNRANVHVATIEYTKQNGFMIVKSLPNTQVSKTMWGLPSQTFHKVSVLMLSPNFWGDKTQGHKHFFFMLQGAANDGQARGFYNEFLREDLNAHRKVFEMVGSKMKFDGPSAAEQLSGLGFSSTQKKSITLRLKGAITRTMKVHFGT